MELGCTLVAVISLESMSHINELAVEITRKLSIVCARTEVKLKRRTVMASNFKGVYGNFRT